MSLNHPLLDHREIAVPSGIEHETWIDGDRADYWTAAGGITVVVLTHFILVGLASLWWKTGRVAETISERAGCAPDIPTRVMITKHGKTAHCRCDCPFFLEAHAIQSLSRCSRCDPNDALEKSALGGGASGYENKF